MNEVEYRIVCLNSLTAREFEKYSKKMFKTKLLDEQKINNLFNLNIKKPDINAPTDVKLDYINSILEQHNCKIIYYRKD